MAVLPTIIKRLTGLPKGTSVTPLQDELVNRVTGNNSISDQLGPGVSPEPYPLDASWLPRAQYYRPGWNLQANPDTDRQVSFQTLRQIADLYDLMRKAIEIRKDEVSQLSWDVVPAFGTTAKKKEMMRKAEPKVAKLREFMKKPDKRWRYQRWMRACIEDVAVVDALSIHKRRTLGGQLYALEQIDGALVRPQLDLQGRTPEPPTTAYEQVIVGVNRFAFTSDELLYLPKTNRIWTPYGFSPVEQFLMLVNLALRHRAWTTAIFTDGNIPQALLSAPEGWSREQIEDLMVLRDQIRAGDPRYARVLEMMPHGVETIIQNGGDHYLQFGTEMSNWIIDLTCVCMDVSRQELGLEPGNSQGLGGSGHAEAQEGVHFRRSLLPLANWLADELFASVLEEFELDDFKWIWPDLSEEDASSKADLLDKKLRSGQISMDEVLLESGAEPVGVGHLFESGGSLYSIKDLLAIQKLGFQGYQAQAEKDKNEHQAGLDQQMETHKSSLAQQEAEHKAGLDQDNSENEIELEHEKQQAHVEAQQQIGEHTHHLMERDAALRHEMALEAAEHGHQLTLEQAEHGSGLQQEQAEHQSELASDQGEQEHGYALDQASHQGGIAGQQQAAQHDQALTQATHQSGLQAAQQSTQHGYAKDQATHQAVLASQATDQQHELALDQADHQAGIQADQMGAQSGFAKDQATHQAGLQGAQQRQQHGHKLEEQGRSFVYDTRKAEQSQGHAMERQRDQQGAQAGMADRQHGHRLKEQKTQQQGAMASAEQQSQLDRESAEHAAKLAPKPAPKRARKAAMPQSVDRFLAKCGYRVEVDASYLEKGGERIAGELDWAQKTIRLYADADMADAVTLAAQAVCLELDSLAYEREFGDLAMKYAGPETDPEIFFAEAMVARASGAPVPVDLDAYFARLERELERRCAA